MISAAVSFIEPISESVDKGIGIFMDILKAFKSVNNLILIRKLKLLGLKYNCLNWFKPYLCNRCQYDLYVKLPHITLENMILKV